MRFVNSAGTSIICSSTSDIWKRDKIKFLPNNASPVAIYVLLNRFQVVFSQYSTGTSLEKLRLNRSRGGISLKEIIICI